MATTTYRFKEITTVPGAKELVDVVLSKTQRKTPTQVHPQFKISRIRSFYMRKIKFCQQTFRDKFSSILQEFPRLDEIHPFYSDLCNVLYDRDHYKLALGQVNAVRGTIDSLGKDYVRLLKYADSQYKCKMLKRAGVGRMVTAVKKLQSSLEYLEEVRQHLGRLPSINPTTRTLILSGYPNVGKSSFINLLSNANVDVQPYAFTTKSLFVGHFDYQYTRWQVVDTPGILDHALEERNTIEMTAVTALAHLPATVLFFVDISEQCGYPLSAQVALFHSIKPLFRHKPLIVVLNKIDARPVEFLTEEEQTMLKSMGEGMDQLVFVPVSCLSQEGVDRAKNKACQFLLEQRVKRKIESKRLNSIQNRLTVTSVQLNAERASFVPSSLVKMRTSVMEIDTPENERDLEERKGGPGVYVSDWRKRYQLRNPEWKHDLIPELLDGRNIADFVDPGLEQNLKALEEEEKGISPIALQLHEIESDWKQTQHLLTKLNNSIKLKQSGHNLKLPKNSRALPRKPLAERSTVSEMTAKLDELEYDTTAIHERAKLLPFGVTLNPKRPSLTLPLSDEACTDDIGSSITVANASTGKDKKDAEMKPCQTTLREKLHAITRGKLVTLPSGKKMLMRVHNSRLPSRLERASTTVEGSWRQQLMLRKSIKKRNKQGRVGEADRFIGTVKPRHLFSGKRGIGKTQRR